MRIEREPFAGSLAIVIPIEPIFWVLECCVKCGGAHVGALNPQHRGRLVFVEHGQETIGEALFFCRAHAAEIRRQAIAEMLKPARQN